MSFVRVHHAGSAFSTFGAVIYVVTPGSPGSVTTIAGLLLVGVGQAAGTVVATVYGHELSDVQSDRSRPGPARSSGQAATNESGCGSEP